MRWRETSARCKGIIALKPRARTSYSSLSASPSGGVCSFENAWPRSEADGYVSLPACCEKAREMVTRVRRGRTAHQAKASRLYWICRCEQLERKMRPKNGRLGDTINLDLHANADLSRCRAARCGKCGFSAPLGRRRPRCGERSRSRSNCSGGKVLVRPQKHRQGRCKQASSAQGSSCCAESHSR